MENYEKKYKDLEGKIKKAYLYAQTDSTKAVLEDILPELAESEDEKIRISIIENLKGNMYRADGDYDLLNKQISWLEKQGEQKPTDKVEPKFDFSVGQRIIATGKRIYLITKIDGFNVTLVDTNGDEYVFNASSLDDARLLTIQDAKDVSGNTKAEHLIPQKSMYYTCIKDYYSSDNTHLCVKGNVYKSSFNGYIDDESHFGLSWTNSCAEKYFEPTKDEAWIVCEHDNVIGKPMQYKEFKKKVNQKFIENLKAKSITPRLRLWNIQDAKDGDVLSSNVLLSKYNKPFIYNGNHNSTHVGAYCGISTENRFNVATEKCRWTANVNIRPATKDQRDTLMKAMTDAGYIFDFEKKELKKVEPKFKVKYAGKEYDVLEIKESAGVKFNGIEDEPNHIDYVLSDDCEIISGYGEKEKGSPYPTKSAIFSEQNHAWSEEDERMMLSIEQIMNCASLLNIVPQKIDKVRAWLKSLKERIGE